MASLLNIKERRLRTSLVYLRCCFCVISTLKSDIRTFKRLSLVPVIVQKRGYLNDVNNFKYFKDIDE